MLIEIRMTYMVKYNCTRPMMTVYLYKYETNTRSSKTFIFFAKYIFYLSLSKLAITSRDNL